MRKYFVDTVLELMEQDEDLFFLTADLGFGSFEVIQSKFPNRYYNVGIAEQNMVGMACGLSIKSKKVIIYSIANFSSLRVIEQIRNYLVYHGSKVLIVNGGGGFSYGQLGYTHYATEDISMMSSLPEIDIFAPFDAKTIAGSIHEWYDNSKVAYLRLEKNEIDIVGNISYLDGFAVVGDHSCHNKIICFGSVSAEAIKSKDDLTNRIEVSVYILYRLKRIPKFFDTLNTGDSLLILEENSKRGGVGQFIFGNCIENNITLKKGRILAIQDSICDVIGDQNYMRLKHGISQENTEKFFLGQL
jgi:transketolase